MKLGIWTKLISYTLSTISRDILVSPGQIARRKHVFIAAPALGLSEGGCKNSYKPDTTRKPSNNIKKIGVHETHKIYKYVYKYLHI